VSTTARPGAYKVKKLNSVTGRRKSKARKLEAAVVKESPRWVRWLAPLLVALVTLAAFLPALHNQFVNWDDEENLLNNPHYRGLGWTQLRWMWTTFHAGHWIPLTWMTFGLDYLLWGMKPFGYHLTSLLLHAANAVVFYFLAREILTSALPGPAERGHALAVSAGCAALLFAIHPLRVESVAWATERRDVLSGLFYLLTILVYLRACERETRGRRWYWLAVGFFACALLSKSMAVSLPVVLLLLDVYPLRRLGGTTGWRGEPARRVYIEKLPFVLLAAAASAVAFLAGARNMAALDQLGVLGRLAISAYGLSFYLWKMVVPLNLSPLYVPPLTVNPWATPFLLSYALVLAITAIALSLRRRLPGLPAAWVAYVVILLPVLGIFQNGPQITADRYSYLAALGWAILAGAGLLSCWRARGRSKRGTPTTFPRAGLAVPVCVVVGLGVLTWNQVQVWHDSERLWTHTVAIDPNSPIPQNGLGNELADQGKVAEAIEHYRQALQLRPDYPEAHYNWGLALARQSELAEAIEHYRQALQLRPDYAEAHNNWGAALLQQGKLAEAIEHFQQALRIKPDFALAHGNWGMALIRQDEQAEMIGRLLPVLRIKPELVMSDPALVRQGKLAEAIEHLQQALRIKPDLAEARATLAVVLAQQGKAAEATEHHQQARSLQGQKVE
jgi:Flp pilus assembly protein TadD